MQREAGRQLVRKLTSDDDLPIELRDDPTEGEVLEGRQRARMLYEASAPVGIAAGVLIGVFVLKKVFGAAVMGPGGLLL